MVDSEDMTSTEARTMTTSELHEHFGTTADVEMRSTLLGEMTRRREAATELVLPADELLKEHRGW